MPRKNTRKRTFFKRNSKKKAQKVSVNKIERIAKKVASKLDRKQEIAVKSEQYFGTEPASVTLMTENLPKGDSVTMRGMYQRDTKAHILQDCWGPKAVLVAPTDDPYEVIDLKDGFRISDQVFLKGIQLRGTFILPSTLHRATFNFVICRKKGPNYDVGSQLLSVEEFIANPWLYNYKKDLTQNTMSILKSFKFHLNQHSGRTVNDEESRYSKLYRKVDKYIPINKKLEYKDFSDLDDPNTASPTDFKKPPYEYRLYSDQIVAIDNNGILKDPQYMPQFNGRVIYHYSCA